MNSTTIFPHLNRPLFLVLLIYPELDRFISILLLLLLPKRRLGWIVSLLLLSLLFYLIDYFCIRYLIIYQLYNRIK